MNRKYLETLSKRGRIQIIKKENVTGDIHILFY